MVTIPKACTLWYRIPVYYFPFAVRQLNRSQRDSCLLCAQISLNFLYMLRRSQRKWLLQFHQSHLCATILKGSLSFILAVVDLCGFWTAAEVPLKAWKRRTCQEKRLVEAILAKWSLNSKHSEPPQYIHNKTDRTGRHVPPKLRAFAWIHPSQASCRLPGGQLWMS